MVLEDNISEISKMIFNYCKSKTDCIADAEDLSQEILLELCRSVSNLRCEDAFYGFMWSVANNVYKQWYRRKKRIPPFCGLDENISDDSLDIMPEEDETVTLLRRELGLLSEKYRRAVILYYIENRSCKEISRLLDTSESMVKHLLFKSRKLLKEGINMERTYGDKSYNPKTLKLLFWFWKESSSRYFTIDGDKIAQNILFACYNDKLTPKQISLEIGVSLPYMENTLQRLYDVGYLFRHGEKYLTNIILFTDDLKRELRLKTSPFAEKIADIVINAVNKNEDRIREIGFKGHDMNRDSFAWQMSSMILYKAAIDDLDKRVTFVHPTDKFGCECVVCGVENYASDDLCSRFGVGISNSQNDSGDMIRFVDFPINGEMIHHIMSEVSGSHNVLFDIAKDVTEFSQNDKVIIAELVKRGFVKNETGGFSVNCPVFTTEQFKAVEMILCDASSKVADEIEKIMEVVEEIVKNHAPTHLQPVCRAVSFLRLIDEAMSSSVEKLYDRMFLVPYNGTDLLPTTFMILNH